jgi:hypothetical protein
MSKRTMALAAVLLAGGIGAASAQGQMPQGQAQGQMQGSGQAQAVLPPGHPPVPVPGSTPPPYSQEVQAAPVVPLGPNIHKPKVNPSAAGTLTEWRQPGTSSHAKTDKGNREHSGSVGTNANTHPLKALEARGKPRQEGTTAPSGVYRTPQPTMEAGVGR